MKKFSTFFLIIIFIVLSGFSFEKKEETLVWGGDAIISYNTGFAKNVMKSRGGVSLFNLELAENDSPGAGFSDKGPSSDVIWGKNRGRKIIFLKDPRTKRAWLVTFFVHRGKYPLKFNINGHKGEFKLWDLSKNREAYRWVEFPAQWLRKGKNIIEVYCPEAKSRDEGWELYVSRADEFAKGGGFPLKNSNNLLRKVVKSSYAGELGYTDLYLPGDYSLKSFDGGKTWKKYSLGSDKKTRGEYSLRISLERYRKRGSLITPVIDTWRGSLKKPIVPLGEVERIEVTALSEIPPDTGVKYYLRKGSDMSPYGKTWSDYKLIGSGRTLKYTIKRDPFLRRYIQIKAELYTKNPLNTPVIKSIKVKIKLKRNSPWHKNIYVVKYWNPTIKYSSINWEWEKWGRPEFKELLERESIRDLIEGSKTEFEAQLRVLDYVTKRWYHTDPNPAYPNYDALSILRRMDNFGGGGFCLTFNNTVAGILTALGWEARHVNIVAHEVLEVWNNDYGKWIFLDADNSGGNYMNVYAYDAKTGEPLNLYEMHKIYLKTYFPNRPIDWMNDLIVSTVKLPKNPPVLPGYFNRVKKIRVKGFEQAAFIRMIPRNNWFEKPYPKPLSHGDYWWPWNGYINWYDEKTPPKKQYSHFTDRPQDMWPDLNLVHIDITSGFGNDRLFLRFETFTPSFSHFEINVNKSGWRKIGGDRYSWILVPGKNRFEVRAVNKWGVKGKPSFIVVNLGATPF